MGREVVLSVNGVITQPRREENPPGRELVWDTDAVIPQIFESLVDKEIGAGFWEYYDVDVASIAANPLNGLIRLVSDVRSFLEPRGRLLSVGCGYGLNEILLSFFCPKLRVVGVDILDGKRSDTKIRSMKTIAREVEADRVTPLLADGGRLPFREGSFDCVLAIDSLSHADYMREEIDLSESQALLLREMSRVVRPGGLLGVIENSVMSPRNVMRRSGTMCHPVNPFYLKSVLERLEYERVRILPYYNLAGRKDLSARFVGAIMKRSRAVGILLAPLFMLGAQKRGTSSDS